MFLWFRCCVDASLTFDTAECQWTKDEDGSSGWTCDCSTSDQQVAGRFCQHTATDTCATPITTDVADSLEDPSRGFCVNGGICVQDSFGDRFCDCQGSLFYGPHCELSDTKLLATSPAPSVSWWPTSSPWPSASAYPTASLYPTIAETSSSYYPTTSYWPTASDYPTASYWPTVSAWPTSSAWPTWQTALPTAVTTPVPTGEQPDRDFDNLNVLPGGDGTTPDDSGGDDSIPPGAVFVVAVVAAGVVVGALLVVRRRRVLRQHGVEESSSEEENWQDATVQQPIMMEEEEQDLNEVELI